MFEVHAHLWTRFALPPESFHVSWKRWFLMSPGRIVWSLVRRIGFPSGLEESPRRLGVRAVEILRSPYEKLL